MKTIRRKLVLKDGQKRTIRGCFNETGADLCPLCIDGRCCAKSIKGREIPFKFRYDNIARRKVGNIPDFCELPLDKWVILL